MQREHPSQPFCYSGKTCPAPAQAAFDCVRSSSFVISQTDVAAALYAMVRATMDQVDHREQKPLAEPVIITAHKEFLLMFPQLGCTFCRWA